MAKRKRSVIRSLFIILFSLFLFFSVFYFLFKLFRRPSHAIYPEFGISIPTNYEIHGIDVSRYQRTIDWGDVKDMQVRNIKIGFAFIKATEGTDMVDEQFRTNWLNAEEEEIPKGAYHYFIAGQSGKKQANNFLEIVKLKAGDLPPVLDVEQTNGVNANDIKTEITDWLQQVEKHCNTKPIIYTNVDFYNNYIKGSFDNYPVWIAHYLQPDKPRINRNWVFWQHSESGHVNGISTMVDFNVFCGDSTEFNNLRLK